MVLVAYSPSFVFWAYQTLVIFRIDQTLVVSEDHQGLHGTTMVVQTLRPRGRSRAGAGVNSISISSPRTMGQYGSGRSRSPSKARRLAHPPPHDATWGHVAQTAGTMRARRNCSLSSICVSVKSGKSASFKSRSGQ